MTTKATTRVICFDEFGGPDVLKLEEIPLAEPGADEVRIRVEAMSLNRADALFRENAYFIQPAIPGSRIGMDAAGVIETAGADVKNVKSGDRVITRIGFDVSKYGAHGETAILPAKFVIKYPEFLSSPEAASIFVPYLTAWGALNDFGADGERGFCSDHGGEQQRRRRRDSIGERRRRDTDCGHARSGEKTRLVGDRRGACDRHGRRKLERAR